MIKERRYGNLIVANDPTLAYYSEASTSAVDENEQEKSDGGKAEGLKRKVDATSPVATGKQGTSRRTSSQTSNSLLSPSRSRVNIAKVPIEDLRAQASAGSSVPKAKRVENAEDILRGMADSLSISGPDENYDDLDLQTDDSDGLPSDYEK